MENKINILCIIVLYSYENIDVVAAGRVERVYLKDDKWALKGGDVEIVCDVSQFNNDVLYVYKSDKAQFQNVPVLTQCSSKRCTTTIERHTFFPTTSSVTIAVTNLQRSEDQKWWIFAFGNEAKELYVLVYTSPKSLVLGGSTAGGDLQARHVTLSCKTSNCIYPNPTAFQWFYQENNNAWLFYQNTSATSTKSCSDSESVYSTTLSLPKYTTWQQNVEKSVIFQCRLHFPALQSALESSASGSVVYAVTVTSVTLKDGNTESFQSLQVVIGTSKTLTCTTNVSRPTATIVWYIGTVEKQRSSSSNSFTFTPQNSDHNKQIFCKAFNTQPESRAVSSLKATLYVQVQVTHVTLKDGNNKPSEPLQVTSGVSKTLTCTPSVSRPTATIVWYIGTVEKQRSNSSNSFTFTPQNSDHNKQIFCKAFNTQPESRAVSSIKATLYVQVVATTPTITNQTTGSRSMLENDSVSMECISSTTRPVAIVTWRIGTKMLTHVKNTNRTATGGLFSVRSIVTFTPNRNDVNTLIYCETTIPGQQSRPVSYQKITVYWPPSTPVIPVTDFPFLEGQTGKTILCISSGYGNPASEATWETKYGTKDSSNSSILNLPKLTSVINNSSVSCQLTNHFTQAKGLQVKSQAISVEVEYTPVVHVLEDGKTIQIATRNEGQDFSATCSAVGYPRPTVRWLEQSSDSADLKFNDINRSDHGTYTCRAEATSTNYKDHNFVTLKNLSMVVNYAPDVTVSLSNTEPTENTLLVITCHAVGRPENYIYTSFTQTWNGLKIQNTHKHVDGVIEIQSLQLQDSGIYTCNVNNGIPDRNQQIDQTGINKVRVKVSPKVLLEGRYQFAGAPGKSVNITVPFYSDPGIQFVMFKFPNGSEIISSIKHDVSYTRRYVTDTFYGQQVTLEGYIAVLHIRDEEESDFINYTLVLDNGIGQPKEWTLYHVSESIPLAPKFLYFTGIVNGVPTFLLLGNSNGGRQQTFEVETSVYGKEEWKRQFKFNETDENYLKYEKQIFHFNITGLTPNTYEVRVLVGNDLGWIRHDEAPKIMFTVQDSQMSSGTTCDSSTAIAIGISLGIVCVLLSVYAVSLTILYKRRTKTKDVHSPEKPANQMTYVNLNFKSDVTENQDRQDEHREEVNTSIDDTNSQYTSLNQNSRDDGATYEILKST